MARALKVYTLGVNGFISPQIRDALGLPSHIVQARVLAVAATKAEAARILDERGFRHVSTRDSEFRVTAGNDVAALTAAGQLAEPGVWVTPMTGTGGSGVVTVQAGGVPQRIGRLEPAPGYRYTFIPEED